MRSSSRIVVAVATVTALLCAWLMQSEQPAGTLAETGRGVVETRKVPEAAPPAPSSGTVVAARATAAAPLPQADVLGAFNDWTARFLAASPEEQAAMTAEGMELARARRPVFKQLIKEDPQAALEKAVPMVARQKLPAEVLMLLEARVNNVGVLRLMMGVPMPEEPLPTAPLMQREVDFADGRSYRAHVYGKRADRKESLYGAALNGVAVDGDFAVNEMPTRTLEVGELLPADKATVAVCPVSGLETEADSLAPEEPVTQETPAVETPTQVVFFCDGAHIVNYNDALLLAEGPTGGAYGFTGILSAAPTPALGVVKVLAMPVTFADQNAAPATEATIYSTLRDVSEFYSRASYGRLTLIGTVSPLVKLPHNEAWYVNRDTSNGGDLNGSSLLHQHAREEVRRMGFDTNDYDSLVVRHTGGPGSYGGLATVPGNTVWVRTDGAGTWAHEIGHSFSLSHANFWDTAGTSSIGSGVNAEYGHAYDIMGTSGTFPSGHYNTQAKNQIKWLTPEFLLPVSSSGQYRIHAFDQGALDPARRYALTIVKDSQRTYWGEVRTLFESNPWVKNGLMLGWRFANAGGSNLQLIDTTNGSPFGKEDAPISLGSTFSDTESGIHLTTLAVNESPRYVDVQVNLGSFPANQRPEMTLAASADVVPLNATVTFTATATDADGDPLAYAWQHFGNAATKIVSPNAAVITRQFTAAGTYVVACTVSDMKGGTITRNKLITVGASTAFTIGGRVTVQGEGLQDVIITANGANGVVTDADGYFTVPNLGANNYTLTPLLYGYSFGELFNNSITVGPSFSGANFEANAQAVVTVTAPSATANELAPVAAGSFRISRTGDTSQLLLVNVQTALGSATKATDYTFAPDYAAGSQGFSTFTIPEGAASLDVVVTPVVDALTEGPETVTLQLGPGNGYLVSMPSTATVTIADDDTALPKVAITATTNSTLEGVGSAPGVLTLSRTGPTSGSLVVGYTVGGTASSGADFTALSGSVTIPAGAATAVVNVEPVNDAVSEKLKTVVLTLAANAAYLVDATASTATVSVYDDDTQTVTVAATDAAAKEVDLTAPGAQADTGTFVVTRSGDTAAALTVYYAFAGTNASGVLALHGVDFEPLPGSVVIPAGETQASITVVPRFDGQGEGPEVAVLYLGASATNYVLGAGNSATVTIEDNAGDLPYVDVVNTASALEVSASGVFRLSYRGSMAALPLRVNYTLSGTATHTSDYDASPVWAPQTSGVSTALNALWGGSATVQWAVGDGGAIQAWNGTAWSAQTSGTTNNLRAVWGTSATNVWAVGDGGTIRRWNGTAWSTQTSNTTNSLRGVWGSDTNNVWAVGDGGTIMKWNGTAWSAQTSGITTALNAVWGSSSTSVWAVGAGGVVRKWNGTTWSAQASGTTETLRGLWGSSSTNVWLAGTGGVVARFNGTVWAVQTTPLARDLTSIWGVDSSNLWASGADGTVLRTSNGGTLWASMVTNSTALFNSVRGSDASRVWVAGAGGALRHYNTAAGTPLDGYVLIPAGATFADVTVRPLEDPLAEDVESVILSITPDAAYQIYGTTSSATMSIRDNDNVNTVFVDTQIGTSGGSSVPENTVTNPTKFYVSRTGSTTAALTVNYTLGGTATSGDDYSALSGSVVIPAGSLGVDVPVTITDDTLFEGVETITFEFAAGSYGRSAGTVMYITDNDTATGTVGFQAPSSSGSESVATVNIPVALSAAQAQPVTVQYAVSSTNSSASSSTTTRTLFTWVRVVKTGSTITHFESSDGTVWTQRGGSFTVAGLGSDYLAGICMASGSATAGSAVVDGFSVTGLSAGGTAGTVTSANLGNAGPSGTHSVASGTYTFSSPGNGVGSGSTSDNFRFVYLPITASADCTVTARLVSLGTAATSRLGVMLRSSTAQDSVYVASLVAGSSGIPVFTLNRATTGAASNSPTSIIGLVLPYWVRIIRTGDSFAMGYSKNGTNWSTIGTTQTVAAGPTVLAGLAVSAFSDGQIATGTFDNVSLDGVAVTDGLLGRTVGCVNEQGSESTNAGVWTVNGSGAGINSTSDEAHFVAREVTGNFTLVARVTSLTGGANTAQAGVMMRHTRDGYSRQVYAGWIKSSSIEQRNRIQGVTNASGSGVDFTLAPGTLVFNPGDTLKNIVLNVTNDSMDEANNLVTLQLSNASGANISTTGTYHGYTIIDDDSPPAAPYVGFAAATSTVVESAGVVGLPVSLSAPATSAGSVGYAVTGGTATGGGIDFTLASGTLNFAAGETVKTIPLSLTDDAVADVDETIILTLTGPVGLQFGSLSTHTVTITDNDLPVVTIEATDATASEAGLDPGVFTFYRTGPTDGTLTVPYSVGGTASSATDRQGVSTSVTFAAGSSTVQRVVTPLNDTVSEAAETTILTISGGASYTIGSPSTATVFIFDDDRSTVTLEADDPTASESGGSGQFTLTRTAPTDVTLAVSLTISGTATNTTDYRTTGGVVLPTSVTFSVGQSVLTLPILPVDDGLTEGDEEVTLSLNAGTYDIGADFFDNVTIADNDSPPTLFINSPASQGPLIASGNGVILSATITDDGSPAPVTQAWSQISGPGVATIESPTAATTAVTFSAPGTYILRITVTDTQFTVSDQTTVVVGSALVAADWITQDLGPSSARRGQGVEFGGQFSVTGTGAGYAGTTLDQAHVMVRQVSGDGSIVARLSSLPLTGALAGVTIRDRMARVASRAVLGFVPGAGLQFRTRETNNTLDVLTASQAGLSLPLWLKLERNASTGGITASYAADSGGTAGTWTQLGATTNVTMDAAAEYGLTTTSNSTTSTATAIFSSVVLTPAPSGPALLSEDAGATIAEAGSGGESGGTTTIVGSTSGYYHGWQYYGDMVVTARLATFSSGAGSAAGGLRVAESMESGAQLHLGRMPSSAYNGYTWTSIAGGSNGGVPSGIAAGNWVRIIRKGNSVTGYRAADVSGSPGTWIQIGQPQTIIMTTPIWVGYYVNNASGVGMNTCTFTGLSIAALNKAPVVGIASVATWPLSPVPLDGSVADDSLPAPVSLTSLWSKRSGPGAVTFSAATLADTNATLGQAGSYVLRLTANDGGAQTFKDIAFTGYTRPFEVWQGQNWSGTGGMGDPHAAQAADADYDGQLNLLEYAFGTSPQASSVSPVIQDTTTVAIDKYLRLTVPKNPNATDVTHTVEVTSTLTNPASWSSSGLIIESNTSTQMVVRDYVPVAPGVQRFMRVRVERVP